MTERADEKTSTLKQFFAAMNWTVLVAGLGYFVDMFDISIFGVVRVASLQAMGLQSADEILKAGVHIYNMQMYGMMLGGLAWGLMADKKGRLSVMFGSILLYSLGNIANAFVWDVNSYALCRFLTGVGLAGELGAAITLVAESLPANIRGYGTTFVATLGLAGSVTAAFTGQFMSWKVAYIVGGCLGLLLLIARLNVVESSLFEKSSHTASVGQSLKLFLNRERFARYLLCIALGVPIYFTTGILFTFSPELTASLGLEPGSVTAGNALLYGSLGLTFGDLLSGLMGQILKSRKRSILISLSLAALCFLFYLMTPGLTPTLIYGLCFVLGLAAGYWAVLVTVAAEQFGTNVRGTVATTVPNFVRGSATLSTTSFMALKGVVTVPQAALIVGVVAFSLAFFALSRLRETYGTNLDYTEQ